MGDGWGSLPSLDTLLEQGYTFPGDTGNPNAGRAQPPPGMTVDPTNPNYAQGVNAAGYLEQWQYNATTVWDPETQTMSPAGTWKRVAAYNMPEPKTGGAGSTWRPGEYELNQSQDALAWQKYATDLALDQATAEQTALRDQWQKAVEEGNLKLQREIEANTQRNNADVNRLNEQRNAIDVYSAQLSSRASLANTAANVATTASEWAANPRNEPALLKLQETGLTGGSATPINAAAYNPATMGQYGTALEQRLSDLFGGVGQQLQDALKATNETPAALQPWYATDPSFASLNPTQQAVVKNYTPAERTDYLNFMNLSPQGKNFVVNQPARPTAAESQAIYAGLSPEGQRYVQEMAKRGVPSAGGGGKMTVNEPTALVGLVSGQVRATMGESGPETVSITPQKKPNQEEGGIPGVPGFGGGGTAYIYPWDTPASQIKPVQVSSMPSGTGIFGGNGIPSQEAQRAAYGNASTPGTFGAFGAGLAHAKTVPTKPKGSVKYSGKSAGIGASIAAALKKQTAGGVPITGPGGTLPEQGTTPTTPAASASATDTPEMKLAKQFAATLKALGVDYTPTAGNYAPPPNLLVGRPWADLQSYPSILAMLEAEASLSGFPWGDYLRDVNKFQPSAPGYGGVSYGF